MDKIDTISAELAKNMFWLACRYAIGRHSYVNTYAYDMDEMISVLNADERRKSAQDIRQCIGDILRMMPYGFTLDCSIPYADRKQHEEVCYPCYVNETKDSVEDDGMMYCTPIAWHYKVVYRPLRYGMTHRCVEPKAITKIERIVEP